MAILSFNYLNISTLSRDNIKTKLTSHINIITATILYCKELSGTMPLQSDDNLANDTLLNTLKCNTTTPYQINGGKGSFIPEALVNFTPYKAKQTANEFYFSTTTEINTDNDFVLQELNTSYSTNQYELTHDATKAYLKFYISR